MLDQIRTTLDKFRTGTVAALIGFGVLAAIPATAQADGVYLNYGNGNGHFGKFAGDRDWRPQRDWQRFCTPERALDKADRMGIWRARIVAVDRHTIRVAGRKFNNRVVVVFGRDANCPIIYR